MPTLISKFNTFLKIIVTNNYIKSFICGWFFSKIQKQPLRGVSLTITFILSFKNIKCYFKKYFSRILCNFRNTFVTERNAFEWLLQKINFFLLLYLFLYPTAWRQISGVTYPSLIFVFSVGLLCLFFLILFRKQKSLAILIF